MMNNKKTNMDVSYSNEVFDQLIDHFISKESLKLANLQNDKENYERNKNSLIESAKIILNDIISNKDVSNKDALIKEEIARFEKYMWGYYVIEPLLSDPDISDIKILSYDNISYKKNGKRYVSDIKFANIADYKRFVSMICTRNKKNFSVANAQVKFSDSLSNPLFRLRFNLSSENINSSGIPSVHIRTISKIKVTLDELVKRKYMTNKEKNYLIERFQAGESVVFIGANASGKTTGVNALLEEFPCDKSALIIQETDELFVEQENHPMVQVQHTVEDNGESQVNHTLYELANVGLMDDDDMFVLGEVKSGEDAGALPALIATGSQVMLTGHGNDEIEGIYKLADYVKQATGYSMDQSLKFFAGLNLVCYIEKYKLKSMSRVYGWDYENECLKISKLDENGNPIDERVGGNVDNHDTPSENVNAAVVDAGDFVITFDDLEMEMGA
jgi:pilus assembly protein CpaF